jgi:hypothetical protein
MSIGNIKKINVSGVVRWADNLIAIYEPIV